MSVDAALQFFPFAHIEGSHYTGTARLTVDDADEDSVTTKVLRVRPSGAIVLELEEAHEISSCTMRMDKAVLLSLVSGNLDAIGSFHDGAIVVDNSTEFMDLMSAFAFSAELFEQTCQQLDEAQGYHSQLDLRDVEMDASDSYYQYEYHNTLTHADTPDDAHEQTEHGVSSNADAQAENASDDDGQGNTAPVDGTAKDISTASTQKGKNIQLQKSLKAGGMKFVGAMKKLSSDIESSVKKIHLNEKMVAAKTKISSTLADTSTKIAQSDSYIKLKKNMGQATSSIKSKVTFGLKSLASKMRTKSTKTPAAAAAAAAAVTDSTAQAAGDDHQGDAI